jgi:hypothetical protein
MVAAAQRSNVPAIGVFARLLQATCSCAFALVRLALPPRVVVAPVVVAPTAVPPADIEEAEPDLFEDRFRFFPNPAETEAALQVLETGYGVFLLHNRGERPCYFVQDHGPDFRTTRPV